MSATADDATTATASISNSNSMNRHKGIWIGIDLGTSNSACAVWDSTRGSPKWIRLPPNISLKSKKHGDKWGRLVPSIVRPLHEVGAQALFDVVNPSDKSSSRITTTTIQHRGSLITSVKRLLGKRLHDIDLQEQLHGYEILNEERNGEIQLKVESTRTSSSSSSSDATMTETIALTPSEVLGILLNGIREGAEMYLKKYATKKQLNVPGATTKDDVENERMNSLSSWDICNAVIGVPAHFSQRQIQLVESAARKGGLTGKVSTCLESTAAAMAYGLSFQETSDDANIMVIDMGGGTSDITIACKGSQDKQQQQHQPQSDGSDGRLNTDSDDSLYRASLQETTKASSTSYQVLVTMGEERLGGDDIDQAMVEYCIQHFKSTSEIGNILETTLSKDELQCLLQDCRDVKEKLCDLESPSSSETISIRTKKNAQQEVTSKVVSLSITITQEIFENILQPWLDKARSLIQRSMIEFERRGNKLLSNDIIQTISEVILVGGTTRIPAIRRMIQKDFFPSVELGVSLNPMSSVAQGLAIQAALISGQVPKHQLRSALMLDCIPHAIGVLLGGLPPSSQSGSFPPTAQFVEILPRNAPLPARGSTTFTLADKYQPGVTIVAVEKVRDSSTTVESSSLNTETQYPVYEPMAKEPFTFLLTRLSSEDYASMDSRTIEVGMKVDKEGRFIVSIFDERDPEQVLKRRRYEASLRTSTDGNRSNEENNSGEEKIGTQVIGYEPGSIRSMFRILWEDSNLSGDRDQLMLFGLLIGTIVMYIGVKVAFNDDLLSLEAEKN